MKTRNKILFSGLSIVLCSILIFSFLPRTIQYNVYLHETIPLGINEGYKPPLYEANVRLETISPEGFKRIYETSNVIVNLGMNRTQYILFGSVSGNLTGMWLSENSTAPTYTWTNCSGAVTGNGLTPAWGSVSYDASVSGGQFTTFIYRNYTYTGGSITIYKACLMHDISIGSPDIPFAIANFASSAPLNNGYLLNVQWNITGYQP